MGDAFVGALLTPRKLFRVVAGEPQPVSGKLEGHLLPTVSGNRAMSSSVTDPESLGRMLAYGPRHPGIRLRFVESKGRLWRGWLEVDAAAPTGDYPLFVFQPGRPPGPETRPWTVRVFPDAAAYRKSFPSLTKRWTGVDPWWAALVLLPVAAVCFVAAFRKTEAEDRRLMEKGIGPIYLLTLREDQWEIVFGLASGHGLHAGDTVVLLDASMRPLQELKVGRVETDHAYAYAPAGTPATHDGYVLRKS